MSITLRHSTSAAAGALWAKITRRPPPPRGQALKAIVTGLGPTFIKGGQLLSTRHDLLRPEVCARLSSLYDRVGPMPAESARSVLTGTYGEESSWPFSEIDWIPTASGSVACVYRGLLPDGRPVAIKIRRPGIEQRMRADFRLLRMGAHVIELLPPMRKVPAGRMVDQLGFAVLRQLSLSDEAVALTRLRANLTTLGHFTIPAPHLDISSDAVLVMDYVDGLHRFAPGEMNMEERRVVIRRVLHGVYQMLFIDGLVHCDMHPGNLYLTRAAQVVLLDAGFVVQLQPAVKRQFAQFFLNMSLGRGADCADIVLASSEHIPANADLSGFRSGIAELVESAHRRTAGQFRLAPFATRLFDLQRRSGIAAAPEFVFPLISLLVLEGMINAFDVDVDFQGEAIPTLLTALRR